MKTFTFNGISSKNHFSVNEIARPLLAPVQTSVINIPQRAGGFPAKNYLGTAEINITVSILANNLTELRQKVRDAAAWLFTEEDKQLIFSDEPDKFYHARVSGETDLSELAETGQTTLRFLLTDVFAYSTTERSATFADDGVLEITNNGTAPAYPVFRVELQSDLTNFTIENFTTGQTFEFRKEMIAGQIYIIDMADNTIKGEVTGVSYLQHVEIYSDWFALAPGFNVIGITGSAGGATWLYTTMTFRERFY